MELIRRGENKNRKIEEEDKKESSRRAFYFQLPVTKVFQIKHDHPMVPFRLNLTDELVTLYGLRDHMTTCESDPATLESLSTYHTQEYIHHLRHVDPDYTGGAFGFDDDCPSFLNLQDYVLTSAFGSVRGARLLRRGAADIVINWHGGYHHAWPDRASGFCYVNDLVLAIQELHKTFQRVLYIDIDAHHGDAVEAAFKSSNRVFTLSFHYYDGEYFPKTGSLNQAGEGEGSGYALNLPLKENIRDRNYGYLFEKVVPLVAETYKPEAVVLQSGADSLAWDSLGMFNLTEQAYERCGKVVKNLGLPYLLTGGGGYNVPNVARCWAHQTAVALGLEATIPEEVPRCHYLPYFSNFDLLTKILPMRQKDSNSRQYLDSLIETTRERMRNLEAAPSIDLREQR